MDPRPVGVFDSGTGGLTVLHECLVTMPHEDFIYLGDLARLPYGPRPLDEIRRFAGEIAGYLEAQGVKLVVAACNAATSAALPELQERLEVPIVGVITPEAHAAVQTTRNRRIGLLATQATVAAGRYAELVHTLDAGARFFPVACPRLVPLIESDEPFGAETVEAVREYATLLKQGRSGHGHPGLHALPADQADLPTRLRPRRDPRLLRRGDCARGGRDTRAEGVRQRSGARRALSVPDHGRSRSDSAPWASASCSFRSVRSSRSHRAGRGPRSPRRSRLLKRGGWREGIDDPPPSGRRPDELRTLTIEPDFLEQASGSAPIPFGKTRVLCTAFLEDGVPRWLYGNGPGWLTAEYSMSSPRQASARNARPAPVARRDGRSRSNG